MDETAPPAPAPAPVPRSIGQRLRAGRERSGLSVAAAAEKLHLDPKVIESLEADRFGELGASVFVRGHLRRYGDFVGEPGPALVAEYTAREARPPAPDLTQIAKAEHSSDPRRLVRPLVALGGALGLLLAIWWVLAGSRADADGPVAQPPENSASAPLPDAAGAPQPMMATATATVAAAAPAPASMPPVTASAPATTQAAALPPRDEPPRNTRLRFELTNDSWVEVYDSRGERLFYDVASAGTVQSIEGRAPLRVVLGHAAGVAVEIDGRDRDIPANALEGEGARFVVSRSGSLSRAR